MGIQVIELTQGKKPWEKEFVDFEFDGRHVSEFGLVVAFGGDRLSLAAFPEFEDETSEIKGATGQLYWGTRFKTLKKTYTLVTDGITEEQLNDFRNHFAPGKYGKFIEDHLLHRYSYCRISQAANFEVVPFRKEIEVMGYKITTNEYKGEIQITFIWDEPFFYAQENYINEEITPNNAAEMVRVAFNNKTPLETSWHGIIFETEDAVSRANIASCCLGADKRIVYENDISFFEEDDGYDNTSTIAYYNPSSIEKSPILSLTYSPIFTEIDTNSWKPVYFANIADDINIGGSKAYNTIEIAKSKELTNEPIAYPKQEEFSLAFKYTSPNIIHSIHRAIQIAWDFYNKPSNQALIELEETLREEISHNKVMNWLAEILNFINGTTYISEGILQNDITEEISMTPLGIESAFAANWFACFNYLALCFFCERSNGNLTANDWTAFMPYQIIFNGGNNTAKIIYSYNNSNKGLITKFTDVEENCGDMTCSPYLKLAGGDATDLNGNIKTCHYLRFRKAGELYQTGVPSDGQVKLEYKYCYM